jgi:hypothetical protein
MPPKKWIKPPSRTKRTADLGCSVESLKAFENLVANVSDIGSSKKQRALEATDSFAKYTDRIKELEVNDIIIQCFVLYKH